MPDKNYYKILHIDRKATSAEVKQSYRKLARMYHPDLTKGNYYHNKFIEINEAYMVLRDSVSRQAYDFRLREEEEKNKPTVTFNGTTSNNTSNVSDNTGNIYKNVNLYANSTNKKSTGKSTTYNLNEFNKHAKAAKNAFHEKSYVVALKEADIALGINSKSALMFELKGDIYFIYENYQEAISAYTTASEIDSKNPKIREKLSASIDKTSKEKKSFFKKLFKL